MDKNDKPVFFRGNSAQRRVQRRAYLTRRALAKTNTDLINAIKPT